MNKNNFLKKEVVGIIDMAKDLAPRFTSLLDPSVWQSPQTMYANLANIATGFVTDRIRGILKDITEDKPEIDEVFLESSKFKQAFIELAKFAAQDNPDDEVWDAAKKLFVQTLRKDTTAEDRSSLYEMMSISRTLSGTEIKIIAGAYHLMNKQDYLKHHNATRWAEDIAKEIGLETADEVLRYEDNLIKQRIIAPREILNGNVHETWLGTGSTIGHRLTDLGRKLAERLNTE